ncbi:nucleoside triphosphatase, partial [Staphylococcus borealis]
FTSKICTNYVENAELCSIDNWNFDSWLDEIACHDIEVYTLLWQVINDCLNGNYTRKKAIFLVGDGNNGKGTFQTLL